MNHMFGFKAFNKGLVCRGKQYKLGVTHKCKEAVLCSRGFHFCTKLNDCFNYYDWDLDAKNDTEIAYVFANHVSPCTDTDSKRVCKELTVLKVLSVGEILLHCNNGEMNWGNNNIGSMNINCISVKGYCNDSCKYGTFYFSTDKISNTYAFNKPLYNITPFTNVFWPKDLPSYNIKPNKKQLYKVWEKHWLNLWTHNQKAFLNLPNFDKKIFKEFTGISV